MANPIKMIQILFMIALVAIPLKVNHAYENKI